MSITINNIKAGIYSKLSGDATLVSLGVTVGPLLVAQATNPPYVSYSIVSVTRKDNFSNYYEDCTVQIDCYAKKTTTKSAQQLCGEMAAAVSAAMDYLNAGLTITGYRSIAVRRELLIESYEEETKLHRMMLQYSVLVESTK